MGEWADELAGRRIFEEGQRTLVHVGPSDRVAHLEDPRLVHSYVVDPHHSVEPEEHHHDGRECVAHEAGAELLHRKEHHQDGAGDADNGTCVEGRLKECKVETPRTGDVE